MDGSYTKPGTLFRSGHLGKLKERGQRKIFGKIGIKKVIDLRTSNELDMISDKIPEGVEYYHFSLVNDVEYPAVTRENRMAMLKDMIKQDGGVRQYFFEYYGKLINNKEAKEGYRNIFKVILNNPNVDPVIIHCTQGKDRTGLAIMLILFALGVVEKKIVSIYHKFDRYTAFYKFYVGLAMTLFVSPRKAKALNQVLSSKKCYIEEAINILKNKYGGAIEYLKNEIGLTEKDLSTLKLMYTYRK